MAQLIPRGLPTQEYLFPAQDDLSTSPLGQESHIRPNSRKRPPLAKAKCDDCRRDKQKVSEDSFQCGCRYGAYLYIEITRCKGRADDLIQINIYLQTLVQIFGRLTCSTCTRQKWERL